MKKEKSKSRKEFERFKGAKIEILENHEDHIKVKLIPNVGCWQPCYFDFTKQGVSCYGDIECFTLEWYNGLVIRTGEFNWASEYYMESKLAHSSSLKSFSSENFEKFIKHIKYEYIKENGPGKASLERWQDLYDEYDVDDTGDYNLDGFYKFMGELGYTDAWEYTDRFYELPYHFYIMLGMIGVINEYFKTHKELQQPKNELEQVKALIKECVELLTIDGKDTKNQVLTKLKGVIQYE